MSGTENDARPGWRRSRRSANRPRASTPSSGSPARYGTPAMSSCPACCSRVLRSPRPHARIRSIDTSKAQALPGVTASSRTNCHVVWAPARRCRPPRGANDRSITTQRRYASTTRFGSWASQWPRWPPSTVMWPKLSVARRRRLRAAAVRARHERGADARGTEIWPEGDLSPTRDEVQPIGAQRSDIAAALTTAARVFEDRYTTRLRAQRADGTRGPAWPTRTRQADRLHPDQRHRQLPARHGPRPRRSGGQGPRRSVRRPMGGDFGNKNQATRMPT